MSLRQKPLIKAIQKRLHEHFGPQHWWPADSPFEVVIGAVLTQNTAWTNVERAIGNLRQAECLTAERLAEIPPSQLEELIRPAGFFRQKSIRLQNIARILNHEWQNSLTTLCAGPMDEARERLLSLSGVGPETADSILLYAADRPSFVVDAYTRRVFQRVGVLAGDESYDEIRCTFMLNLPEDVQLFNEYHAQIVRLAKTCCRKKKTFCSECPLNDLCQNANPSI